jgi:sigma-E factor negative regulatory protein RseB
MAGPISTWRCLGGWLFVAALLPAAAQAGSKPTEAGPAEAQAWLSRINAAASEGNYRGTMVFTASGVVSSSKVAHVCVGDEIVERVEALDGHLHRVYRRNETVHTVWPHRKVVVVEQRAAAPGLVSTRRRVEPAALGQYRLSVLRTSHVAGRSARQLLLSPKDGLRFAQQLWADEASGLLLRQDVIGPDGRVLESSAFTEVEIGGRADTAKLLEGMLPEGYQVVPSRREAVDLAAQGWGLRQPVPGFELLGCVKRPAIGESGDALQAVYTDGLSYVSLFIEPYHEQRHPRALAAEMGAMHTVMQRSGDHWITAMGDVPRATLERFIQALERRR